MKKLGLVALVVMVGAGIAVASSMSVPWFVDRTATNVGIPPKAAAANTQVGLAYLNNGTGDPVTCSIQYFTQDGYPLPFDVGQTNTFVIPALSTMAFRPCANDLVDGTTNPQGQEGPSGALVPNRPKVSSIPGGAKDNGSCVITWVGPSSAVKGIYTQGANIDGGLTGRLTMWGTLLPSGS